MTKAVKVGGDDRVELIATRDYDGRNGTMVHHLDVYTQEARFAMACAERWGMVAGEPDGEDSAGRQKLRRMTAIEISKHACNVAQRLFGEMRERGMLVPSISYDAIEEALRDAEDRN